MTIARVIFARRDFENCYKTRSKPIEFLDFGKPNSILVNSGYIVSIMSVSKDNTQNRQQPVVCAFGADEAFEKLINSPELHLQVCDRNPIPIEIFAPDGTCIFYNQAAMKLNGITDLNLLVGHYNLKNDPVCLEILGQEFIDRMFRGEECFVADFPVPIQDVVDHGYAKKKPFEAATMDIYAEPVWDGDTFVCTICFFIVKHIYHGKAEMVKAQEHMDENWLDPFDRDKIAAAANMSPGHFSRMFKKISGMTPQYYYEKVKVEKIKEKLLDPNLTVTQAFSECGVDSKGKYLQHFKNIAGMTPTEFRAKNTHK